MNEYYAEIVQIKILRYSNSQIYVFSIQIKNKNIKKLIKRAVLFINLQNSVIQ